jgi:hypothetical protein
VHHFPGGTKAQYDAVLKAVHVKDKLPEGQLFHAAGQSADGWTVIAVHDSKESWERFRDTILMPKIKQGISGGFTSPPRETTFEVHNLMP